MEYPEVLINTLYVVQLVAFAAFCDEEEKLECLP
jgi:hypothetical protein